MDSIVGIFNSFGDAGAAQFFDPGYSETHITVLYRTHPRLK